MWKGSICIAVTLIILCNASAAQQPVELVMRSGDEIEGVLDAVGRDSLRILQRVEMDFPMRHERDIPFSYALRDVLYVDVTIGESAGHAFLTRLASSAVITVAMAYLATDAVGKDPEESWPSNTQVLAGSAVGAVTAVVGFFYTLNALTIDSEERHWMDVPSDIEALRDLAATESGKRE